MKHSRPDYARIQDPAGLIPENEPVFLLRGQDKYASNAVYMYANHLDDNGVDPTLVRMAREQAQRMADWSPRQTPDITNAQMAGCSMIDDAGVAAIDSADDGGPAVGQTQPCEGESVAAAPSPGEEGMAAQSDVDPHDDLQAWSIDNFRRIPEADRQRCLSTLRSKLLESDQGRALLATWVKQVNDLEQIGSDDLMFHFHNGMAVRNILRDVLKDEKLPPIDYSSRGGPVDVRNWDDFYLGAIYELAWNHRGFAYRDERIERQKKTREEWDRVMEAFKEALTAHPDPANRHYYARGWNEALEAVAKGKGIEMEILSLRKRT